MGINYYGRGKRRIQVQAPIAPTLTSPWTNYGGIHADVTYYKDPDGFVTLSGLASGASNTTVAFTLPVGYRPVADCALATIANDQIAYIDLDVDNGFVQGTMASQNGWFSFSGRRFPTADVTGWVAPTLNSPWVNWGAGRITAGYVKDSCGFVHLKGELNGGSMGSTIFTLPEGFRPPSSQIFQVFTHASDFQPLMGRLDIDPNGNVVIQTGNSYKVGLTGITFPTFTEGWKTMTPQNSWAGYNYINPDGEIWAQAQYYIDKYDLVHFMGLIRGGLSNAPGYAGAIGHTYSREIELFSTITNPNAIGRVDLGPSGQMFPWNPVNNGWISFDGLSTRVRSNNGGLMRYP